MYTAADYLVQRATLERGRTRIPASAWEALTAATFDRDDTFRLARSADLLHLHSYAISLYWRLHDAGESDADDRLFQLLGDRGDADGLRVLAETGHEQAATWLAVVVADSDPHGVIGRLVNRGDADGLRELAADGDRYAAERLTFLLADRGQIADLVPVLEGRADDGDRDAAADLVGRLLEHQDFDRLRSLAADDFPFALVGLVNRLFDLGDQARLRELANDGHWYAIKQLAYLLHSHADRDGLRDLALAADYDGYEVLAGLLEDLGGLDGQPASANQGTSRPGL